MTKLFRSKPSEVEAIQWLGLNYTELLEFGASFEIDDRMLYLKAGKDGVQGLVPVPHGHWIVRKRGDMTDHWPVDNEYFTDKYEAVSE